MRRDDMTVQDCAREELARILHWKMEHLDPSNEGEWGNLSERQKEFYRLCVRAILNEAEVVMAALEAPDGNFF